MRDMLNAARPWLGSLSRLSLRLASAGLVAMTGIVAWQIFGRYVLNNTPSWSEPLALHLMSWFILLGAAVGVRESVHLGLDLLHHMSSPSVRRAMDMISLTLITGFGIAMAAYGAKLAIGTWNARIPVLGWPGGVDFFPLIAGGALIAIFACERLLDVMLGAESAATVISQEVV